MSAERASQELREQARRESELVLDEAHAEARAITRRARAEREHLTSEACRIRTLLRAALDVVEVGEVADVVGDVEPGEEEGEREAA